MSSYTEMASPNSIHNAWRRDKKTKIVCTLGPATSTPSMIYNLLRSGMDILRLDMSSASHDFHRQTLQDVRFAAKMLTKQVAVILDTKGSLVFMDPPGGEPIKLLAGQELVLVTSTPSSTPSSNDASTPSSNDASSTTLSSSVSSTTSDAHSDTHPHSVGPHVPVLEVSIDFPELPQSVQAGSLLYVDNGTIELTVLETDSVSRVRVRVSNSQMLSPRMSLHIAGCKRDCSVLTDKDMEDIKFGVENDVDFVAISARNPSDIERVRSFLGLESPIKIVAKIDHQFGLDNLTGILALTDAVLVSRGNLGVEIPMEKVCSAQKAIIHECNLAGKPVITAMQMLESMVIYPQPTRAEATDVSNSVFDGTDAILLSSETSVGSYPLEAVSIASRICIAAEKSIDYSSLYLSILTASRKLGKVPTVEAVTSSAVKTAFDLHSPLIVVLTETGLAARSVAKYRPFCPVLVLTARESSARQCVLSRACEPLIIERKATEVSIKEAIEFALSKGLCQSGDNVVVVSGVREGVSGATDQMKVIAVE